jgi:hypothetical protein
MRGPSTAWEKVFVCAETAKYLRGTHELWSRLLDGEHVFTVVLIGHQPGPNDGGYNSIASALAVKGMA